MTPRSKLFADHYLTATERALKVWMDDTADGTSLTEAQTTVLFFDRWIESNKTAFWIPAEGTKELIANVKKLKLIEFYSRYGNYLAFEMEKVNDAAGDLRGYWNELAAKLESESADGVKTRDKHATAALRTETRASTKQTLPKSTAPLLSTRLSDLTHGEPPRHSITSCSRLESIDLLIEK